MKLTNIRNLTKLRSICAIQINLCSNSEFKNLFIIAKGTLLDKNVQSVVLLGKTHKPGDFADRRYKVLCGRWKVSREQ